MPKYFKQNSRYFKQLGEEGDFYTGIEIDASKNIIFCQARELKQLIEIAWGPSSEELFLEELIKISNQLKGLQIDENGRITTDGEILKLPLYFASPNYSQKYMVTAITGVENGQFVCKGTKVQQYRIGTFIRENQTFFLPVDAYKITEEDYKHDCEVVQYYINKEKMEDNQWDFTSTNEFKEKRFASVEPGYYENMVLTTEQHINELKMEMANAITYGYIDLTKRYGVLTPNGYILDVSATKFLFSNGPCYLQEISSCLGTVYITSKRGKELSKCRLEHCPNDAVDRAKLLDMLVYYFEHL